MPDYTGKRVGNYTIVRKLGEGGFAAVYLAQHTVLDKKAAVKFLLDDWVNEPDVVARFFDEARTMEKLQGHPNIIPIIDIASKEICEKDGLPPYFIMDFVDGLSLEQRIKSDEGFTLEWIIKISIDVLSALGHCHDRSVIHRDIKPSNILLGQNDQVILTDFGIAKGKANTSKTGEGIALGSTDYMSPEQALGKRDLDHRSDIYSFGITLYEMVVGKLPFTGDNPNQVAIMHIQEVPKPPIQVNPAVPAALNFAILKAIAKKPEDRFVNCAEMIEALKQVLINPDGDAPVEVQVEPVKLTSKTGQLPEDAIRTDEAKAGQAFADSPPHVSRINAPESARLLRSVVLTVGLIAGLVALFIGGFIMVRQMTVGQLIIDSEPRGAQVMLNGKVVGTTPVTVNDVDPNWHKVTIEAEGYRRRVETVEVKARATSQIKRSLMRLRPEAMPAIKAAIDEYIDAHENDRSKNRNVRLSQAMAGLEKVLDQYWAEEPVHLAYLDFCVTQGLLARAEAFYQGQRQKYPGRSMPKLMLGLCYLRANKLDDAMRELNAAFVADKDNITVLNALGEFFDRKGKPDQAKIYYQSSYFLDPDQPQVRERLATP